MESTVDRRRDAQFSASANNETVKRIDLGGTAARQILSCRGGRIGHRVAEFQRGVGKLLDIRQSNS